MTVCLRHPACSRPGKCKDISPCEMAGKGERSRATVADDAEHRRLPLDHGAVSIKSEG